MRSFMLLSLFILMSFAVTSSEQKKVVRVSHGLQWHPYAYTNEQGQMSGKDIDVLQTVLNRIGYQLKQISGLPVRRLTTSNKGLGFNAVLGVTYTDKRAETNYFSIPYRKERIGVYVTNPNFLKYQNIEQMLKDKLVGSVNRSAFHGKTFEQLSKQYSNRLSHSENARIRLNMLTLGRVDFIINDMENMDYLIAEAQVKQVLATNFFVVEQDVSFMFLKSEFSAKFIERFNATLHEELQRNKELSLK